MIMIDLKYPLPTLSLYQSIYPLYYVYTPHFLIIKKETHHCQQVSLINNYKINYLFNYLFL